jgi:hypothetical protein
MFTRRTLKLIAISYAVKTLVFGAAWLAIPDLPQRAATHARSAWAWASGAAPAATTAAAPR